MTATKPPEKPAGLGRPAVAAPPGNFNDFEVAMTPEDADKAQAWLGMDGATAWHLIDRHADNWADVSEMMNAWLRANVIEERAACAKAAESAALDAARQWWEGNRPCGWTQAQHIAQPFVNAGGSDCSLRLAAAVGHLVEMERGARSNDQGNGPSRDSGEGPR